MKRLGIQQNVDVAEGVQNEIKISFEANAVAFYAQVSGLAKDKISYPIREICTNAWDASKGDFDVHLPTLINPVFSVRDRGPGMSPTIMKRVYARLYASTKRDINTEVGGWGLGSKSPFAYLISENGTGTYTITSYNGGMMRTYTMSIDKSGEPVLRLLFEAESDEPTGVEVSFAVRREDVQLFSERAQRILWSFSPRPKITPSVEFQDGVVEIQGDGWTQFRRGSVPFSGPMVRMGPVMYPFDLRQIDRRDGAFLDTGDCVLFDTEIGSVSPTLSREDLSYDDGTKATLRTLVERYEEQEIRRVQDAVDAHSKLLDASAEFAQQIDDMTGAKKAAMKSRVNWRGTPVITDVKRFGDDAKFMLLPDNWAVIEQFWGGGKIDTERLKNVPVALEHNAYRSMERFQEMGLGNQRILWIRVKRADKDRLLAFLGNPSYVTMDDVKLPAKEGIVKRPKHLRKRRVLHIGEMYGDIRVDDIDMTARNICIRKVGQYWRSSNYFKMAENGQTYGESVVVATVRHLRTLGLIDPSINQIVPVLDDEDKPENWVFLEDHVGNIAAHFRGLVSMEELGPFHGVNNSAFSSGILNFSSMFAEVGRVPMPISQLIGDIDAILAEMRQETRQSTKSHTAIAALRSLGMTVDTNAASRATLIRIRELEARKTNILQTYPLLAQLMVTNYGGGSRRRLLGEYFRLLEAAGESNKELVKNEPVF